MAALSNVEIGSVIYGLIKGIPTGISGTNLTFLVNQSVYTAENYTGNAIPLSAIANTYQPAVVNLTISQVLGQMEAQGIGTKNVKIGELTIAKGMQEGTSKSYSALAYKQMDDLGQQISSYQTWN